MSSADPTPKACGIGSIAHLFLSDPSPETTSPRSCVDPFSSEPVPADPAPMNTEDVQEDAPAPLLTGEILLADHLDHAERHILSYARRLSREQESVALVKIDQRQGILFQNWDRADSVLSETLIAESPSIQGCSDLYEALFELSTDYDILLLFLSHAKEQDIFKLIRMCTWITILTTPRSEDTIKTYQKIKWLRNELQWGGKISIFICDIGSDTATKQQQQSQALFHQIKQTAERFLNQALHFAGYETEDSQGIDETSSAAMPSGLPISSGPADEQTVSAGSDRFSPVGRTPIRVEPFPQRASDLMSVLIKNDFCWLKGFVGSKWVYPLGTEEEDYGWAGAIDVSGLGHFLYAGLEPSDRILPEALVRYQRFCEYTLPAFRQEDHIQPEQNGQVPSLILVTPSPTRSLEAACSGLTEYGCRLFELVFLESDNRQSLLLLPRV